MAKRKKRKSTGSGGAFGGSRKAAAPAQRRSSEKERQWQRDQARFMGMVRADLAKREFKDEAEMQAYLNENFIGRPIDEMLEDFDATPQGRVDKLLDSVATSTDPREICQAVEAALEIDPGNLDAEMVRSLLEPDLQSRIARVTEIVETHREKLAEVISESTENGLNLWGFPETRPFLSAMEELGTMLREAGDFEKSTSVFQQILEWSPGDNLGIRNELLVNHLALGNHDRAEALMDQFENEKTCDFLYGKAYLEFTRAWSEAPGQDWELGDDDAPFANLPEELFGEARQALEEAVQTYPWSLHFLIDQRVRLAPPISSYEHASPSESFIHAQRALNLWIGDFIAATWLAFEGLEFLHDSTVMERVIGSSDEYQGLAGAIDEDKLDLRVVRDRVLREGLQHLQELSGLMASALQTIIEIGEDEEVWREAS